MLDFAIHDPLPALRVRRGVEHLRRCGDRATTECLLEFARQHGLELELVEHLARWGQLDPRLVRGVLREYGAGAEFTPTMRAVS
jgi:hypothetical protein